MVESLQELRFLRRQGAGDCTYQVKARPRGRADSNQPKPACDQWSKRCDKSCLNGAAEREAKPESTSTLTRWYA